MTKIFEKYDVLLTPVAPTTAFGIGEKSNNPLEMYLADICTVSINIAGVPAISIPCGVDSEGMPIGMQLIGNRFDEETLNSLNQRYIPDFAPDDQQGYITLTTHNYQAQQLNNRKLAELPGKSYTFNAEINNDFPEYSYPTDNQLELKNGAQVMFVKNDSSGEHRYYNGKIGKIVFINPNKINGCRRRRQ